MVNIILVLQMRRNDYTVIVADVYIIFIVVFLTIGLIPEIVVVVLSQQTVSECFRQYYTSIVDFLRDAVIHCIGTCRIPLRFNSG